MEPAEPPATAEEGEAQEAAPASEYGQPFEGRIAESYAESEEWWPSPQRPPEGAPNVLLILLDDTGFAHFGSYGGLVETPNLDALAERGLRYNNFHTTALCSPSRASLMAGRNPHRIGLGSHSLTAMGFPGYNALIPPSAQSGARVLQEEGYGTYAIGKWDHTPLYEVSLVGPFDHWPGREGFNHFYGFMAADTDNWHSVMWNDQTPVEPWRGRDDYHLSTDMADRAIEWMTGHESVDPDLPWLMFWAPGAMHSPHHAPEAYIERYRGRFDDGWDVARERILARQVELGIVPEGTELSPRAADIPAWDSLPEEEKRLYRRQMEVFAGQLEHLDHEIGRMLETVERVGDLNNTLVIVTSDNGASAEGGLTGSFNETYVLNGLQTPLEANLSHLEDWGGPTTYPHYHAGWAMAGNTPFRYFKQTVHRGGIQDPLIISWPDRIEARGEIRNQYHHITDIMPTLFEATGIDAPEEIGGIRQLPFDGISMVYTFDDADAPTRKEHQFYEMFGNRAIWQDGWKAVSLHANRMPWNLGVRAPFDDDTWELYHVAEDVSESHDLAGDEPERLAEMVALWERLAWENNAYPLHDDMVQRIAAQQDRLFGDRTEFVYFFPGATRIAEKASAPVKNRSHSISTTMDLQGNERGVIVACGGFTGGYTLFIDGNRLRFAYNFYNGVFYELESPSLPMGETTLEFRFVKTGEFEGRGELYVNGEQVDEVAMPDMHRSTFSLSETFDVGRDSGTPVAPQRYETPFAFEGSLDRVTIRLTQGS
ncbi:MAG: arylsulfatase [Sandaracinaceae bacterium]